MKTNSSQRILLIAVFSALLSGPAFAAFGDNPSPSATAVSGARAAGSAVPPGTHRHKKTASPPKHQKAQAAGKSTRQPSPEKPEEKALTAP
ncbi:hypothetical protein [Pseudomonas kitaguniensis]|uniref:hypothetical protein n=1 Tax=Pseudomonas kitaguniensis TaxID=2607908 RepID=UPI003D0112FE